MPPSGGSGLAFPQLEGAWGIEGLERSPGPDRSRDLRAEKQLGVGAYGRVFLVHDRAAKGDFALKVAAKSSTRRETPEAAASLLREAAIVQQLDHPNVVRMHGAVQTESLVMFLMDYVGERNLMQWQKVLECEVFAPVLARRMYQHVAGALRYCHARGIAHRNINQENIVMRVDPPMAVLVDFGDACSVEAPCEHVGTVRFMAPEVMALMHADFEAAKADVWSLGVLLLEMLCGPNFLPRLLGWSNEAGPDDPALPRSLWSFLCQPGSLTRSMQRTRHALQVSTALENTLQGLLSLSVLQRWTAARAVASAWLRESEPMWV